MRRHRATSCARCTNSERALGKPGEEVRGRRTFRLLILQGVLHGERHLRSHGQQNPQVVRRKRVQGRVIHGQHAHHAIQSLQGNRQRRRQNRVFLRVGAVACFYLRIAIDDGLAVLRHPSAQAFAHADFQRRQDAKVFAAHQFRQQPAIAVHVYGDGVVGNQLAQPHRQHRKRLAQAQRVSQILAQLEHGLRLLPGRCDRRQEVGLVRRVVD